MNIKRIVFASLFCIAVLLCAGKKAEAAFPYDMEQKPVTATSIPVSYTHLTLPTT